MIMNTVLNHSSYLLARDVSRENLVKQQAFFWGIFYLRIKEIIINQNNYLIKFYLYGCLTRFFSGTYCINSQVKSYLTSYVNTII